MAKSRSSKIPEALQLWVETGMAVTRLFRLLKQGMDPEKSRQVLKVLESANRRIEAITGANPGQPEASVKFDGLKEVSAKQLRKLMEKTPVLKVKMEFAENLAEEGAKPEKKARAKAQAPKDKPAKAVKASAARAAAKTGAKAAAKTAPRRPGRPAAKSAAKPAAGAAAEKAAPAAPRRRGRPAGKSQGKAA